MQRISFSLFLSATFLIGASILFAGMSYQNRIEGESGRALGSAIFSGICSVGFLTGAYRRKLVDWIHLPLVLIWTAFALGGEKYIAGEYSLTKWEVGDGYLFGTLVLGLAAFLPLHIWELKDRPVETSRNRLIAFFGTLCATMAIQAFLRFNAEAWVRRTLDAWGFGIAFVVTLCTVAVLGFVLIRLQQATKWVPFLPSLMTPHR